MTAMMNGQPRTLKRLCAGGILLAVCKAEEFVVESLLTSCEVWSLSDSAAAAAAIFAVSVSATITRSLLRRKRQWQQGDSEVGRLLPPPFQKLALSSDAVWARERRVCTPLCSGGRLCLGDEVQGLLELLL